METLPDTFWLWTPSSTKELKPIKELSVEESGRTKAEILPPLVRCETYEGFAYTTPLIEVFQFRIDKFDDNERRGEVYGKIEVVDSMGSHTLYDQSRANTEHIRANSAISLVGPYRSIVKLYGIAINIDLSLRDVKDVSDLSVGDSMFGKWQFSWDAAKHEVAHINRGRFLRDVLQEDLVDVTCKHQSAGYDQPLMAIVEGPKGSCVTMHYAILQHALQAWVKVEVFDVELVPTPAEYIVRGSIFASYSNFEHEKKLSTFKRKKGQPDV